MTAWPDLEAEVIVDALAAFDGTNDLRTLQKAIAKALDRFYKMGRTTTQDQYT